MDLSEMMEECEEDSFKEFGSMKAQVTPADVPKLKAKPVSTPTTAAAIPSLFGDESEDEDFNPNEKKKQDEDPSSVSDSESEESHDEEEDGKKEEKKKKQSTPKEKTTKPEAPKKKTSKDASDDEDEEKKTSETAPPKKHKKKSESSAAAAASATTSDGDSKNKKTQPKWLMPPVCQTILPEDAEKEPRKQRVFKYFKQVSFDINGDVKTFNLRHCVKGFGCMWVIKDMLQEPVKKSAIFRVAQVVPVSELKGVPDGIDEKIEGRVRLVQTNRWALIEKKQIYRLEEMPVSSDGSEYTTLKGSKVRLDGTTDGDFWFDTSLCAVVVEPGTETMIDAKLVSGPITKLFPKSMFEEGGGDDNVGDESDKQPKRKSRAQKIVPFEFMYVNKPAGIPIEKFMKDNYLDGNVPVNCRFRVDEGYEESEAVKKRRQSLLEKKAEDAAKEKDGDSEKSGEEKKKTKKKAEQQPKKKEEVKKESKKRTKENDDEEDEKKEVEKEHHHHHGKHEKKDVKEEDEGVVLPKKDTTKAKKEEQQPQAKKKKVEKDDEPASEVVLPVPPKTGASRIILKDAGGNSTKDMTLGGMINKVKSIVDSTNSTETTLAVTMLKSLKEAGPSSVKPEELVRATNMITTIAMWRTI